ncbi:unnamed protein product, partial [marine sediment metagenome]
LEGASIGGLIIYSSFEGDNGNINFDILMKTDPLTYLKKQNNKIIDFIQSIEKEKKRLETIASKTHKILRS